MTRPLLVGLTGGIASGKSTAARHFLALGAPVVDADAVAREVVEPGQPALAAIRERFGEEVMTRDGTLDRAALRALVFRDPDERRALEAILHPRIRARMFELAAAARHPYCILEIPLLVEGGLDQQLDRVIVVDVPESVQRERLRTRDGLNEAEMDAMLAAQATRSQRLAVAHHLLDNTGSPDELAAQVAELDRTLIAGIESKAQD